MSNTSQNADNENSSHGIKLIRVACITKNNDIENLIRKYAFWGNTEIDIKFFAQQSYYITGTKVENDIIIVDVSTNAEESKFFKLLRDGTFRGSQILVLCNGTKASEWHTYVMDKEIFDYFIIRPLYDPYRLRTILSNMMESYSVARMFQTAMLANSAEEKKRAPASFPLSNSPFALFEGIAQYSKNHPDFAGQIDLIDSQVKSLKIAIDEANLANSSQSLNILNPTESNRRILLLEDDEKSVGIIKDTLESHNFEIMRAISLDDIVERFLHIRYDLIILDIMVPEIKGVAAVKLLDKHLKLKEKGIPILITSEFADEELIFELKELGSIDFILKPIHPRTLLKKVGERLKKLDTPIT